MSLVKDVSNHFLKTISFLRKQKAEEIAEKTLPLGMPIREDHIGMDIQTLTRTQLRERYPHEYNSWRNAKTRAKDYGVEFDERFREFPSFLNLMGIKGALENSLERNVAGGPYTFENCRWANKQEQSDNRRNVIPVVVNGVGQTIAKWARDTGQRASTLYKRRKKGLPALEVVGRKATEDQFNLKVFQSPWPPAHRAAWEKTYLRYRTGGEFPCEFYYRYSYEQLKLTAAPIIEHGVMSLDDVDDEELRERLRPTIERWQASVDDAAPKLGAFRKARSDLHERKLMDEARNRTGKAVGRDAKQLAYDAEAEQMRETFGLR